MIQIGTLVFTDEGKVKGVQYLGRLNRGRTVAQTMLKLCRQYGNCTAYEVLEDINFQIFQLREAKSFPEVETLSDWDIKHVKQHITSVVQRSQAGQSKFIPRGIKKVSHSEYYFIDR